MGKMGSKQDIFITSDNLHKGFKKSVNGIGGFIGKRL